MPPRAKITRDMIVDCGLEIVRAAGIETVNARTVAGELGCSTQPVMYHFKTIEDLKRAIYQKADQYHTAYIMEIHSANPMQDIGLNYIRFAAEEKNLFRFLFQSNEFSGRNMGELIDAPELQPIMDILSQQLQVDTRKAKTLFRSLFLMAHGYASMLANNEMAYDSKTAAADLALTFRGAVLALKEEG